MLELSGAQYMIRGLGYLHVADRSGERAGHGEERNARLIKDLGTVSLRPRHPARCGGMEGEGETVGGIVVMRYGLNALNVIDGVKSKASGDQALAAARSRSRRGL